MPERLDPKASPLRLDPDVEAFLRTQPGIELLGYRDGEHLVREGETSREIFVLVDGALVVERAPLPPATAPAIVACLSSEAGPAIVGEMAYLGGLRRTASVRSSGWSRVLRLEPAHVDAILDACPALTRIICRQFSLRLQETLHALTALQARFALDPERRMAQDGEVLFQAGEPAERLHQLLAGSVRLEGPGGVRTVNPESLPAGFLDLGAYLDGGPRWERAVVDGMAFLSILGPGDREAVVRTFPRETLEALRPPRA